MSIVIGAYFDFTIDVVHTIMASHFAVMMMVCMTTASEIPQDPTVNDSDKRRDNTGVIFVLVLAEVIMYPLLLAFNLSVWTQVRHLQRDSTLCPNGAGIWVFFGDRNQVIVSTRASTIAFIFVVCNTAWESACILGLIGQIWTWIESQRRDIGKETQIYPIIWLLQKFSENDPSVDRRGMAQIAKYFQCVRPENDTIAKYFRLCIRLSTFIYVVTTTEIMIDVNDIRNVDAEWSFGQIFVLTMMCFTVFFVMKLSHDMY